MKIKIAMNQVKTYKKTAKAVKAAEVTLRHFRLDMPADQWI